MTHPKINFKNRFVAGLLGYLVPGTGHLYQGRTFKGIVYFVCIFGMFLSGMALSDWRCVNWSSAPGQKTFGYFAQLGVGLPSIPAYFQSRRFYGKTNNNTSQIDGKLTTKFSGRYFSLTHSEDEQNTTIEGELKLERVRKTFEGTFQGNQQIENGATEEIELKLGQFLSLEKPLKATRDRGFTCGVIDEQGEHIGDIIGNIPRGFYDRFEMPLDDDVLQKMHDAGRPLELALVMTWIAGLLNILAVWDAVEGPAYGYDDEELKEAEKKKTKEKETAKKSELASQKPEEEKTVATAAAEKTATESTPVSSPASTTPASPATETKEGN